MPLQEYSNRLTSSDDDREDCIDSSSDKEEIEYLSNLLATLNKARAATDFCDMELLVDSKCFKVHTNIMTTCSPYCLEKVENLPPDKPFRLTIDNISAVTMETVLNFIYSGQVQSMQWSQLEPLMDAANLLQVVGLMQFCINFVRGDLAVNNVVDTLRLARRIKQAELESLCLVLMAFKLSEMSAFGFLDSLTPEEMRLLLLDKRLVVRKNRTYHVVDKSFEEGVHKIVLRWQSAGLDRCQEAEKMIAMLDERFYEKKTFAMPFHQTYSLIRVFGNHWELDSHWKLVSSSSCYSPREWFIKALTVFVLPNWQQRRVVAGFNVTYKNRWSGILSVFEGIKQPSTVYEQSTFELEDTERILGIKVSHGLMIYSITFRTSLQRDFGPFGSLSDEIESVIFLPRQTPLCLHLHGFSFTNYNADGLTCVNKVKLECAILDRSKYCETFGSLMNPIELQRLRCFESESLPIPLSTRVNTSPLDGPPPLRVAMPRSESNLFNSRSRTSEKQSITPLLRILNDIVDKQSA